MVTSTESVPDEVASDKLQKIQSPVSGVLASQSDQEGSTPSIIPDKASEVGFNWRKYGQKNVRGNLFIRSYYRCTHPSCQVKKQVERSLNGQITDTLYFGKHDHPKPQPGPPIAVGFVLSIQEERSNAPSVAGAEEKSSNAHGQTSHHVKPMHVPPPSSVAASADDVEGTLSQSSRIRDEVDKDEHSDSKRQKKNICDVDATPVDKPTGETRLVVQTLSEVDIVNDGYRWRKYGQKFVKGNQNPRSYYRCSNAGCPVKKHVERASDNPKVVITTYEGQHDHDMPPARTVTHNTAGPNTNATALNGESRTKLDESGTDGPGMAAYNITVPDSKSSEQLNGESISKTEENDTVGSDMAGHSSLDPESKSSEQVDGKSRNKLEESETVGRDSETVGCDSAVPTSLGSESTSKEQPEGVLKSKLEESDSAARGTVVHDSLGLENKPNEQQKPNAEPVQS
ncbi:hypothetical protein L1049_024960 [Liquidambar formosana]|uniref:WRKY domain-containing protein n=1 Tax=Liquidambar formosana TaxID=63359 RepID=A0AAP0X5H8_LIQFO